jgi:hypothetical protein
MTHDPYFDGPTPEELAEIREPFEEWCLRQDLRLTEENRRRFQSA